MTPREYAEKVKTKFGPLLEKTPPSKLFLRDKVIFYVGGDLELASSSTRAKMDFLRKKGATVLPTYDPDVVTHIVIDKRAKGSTLKALKLNSLDEIPDYIPTVTWDWVTPGHAPVEHEFMFSAFADRMDSDSRKASANRNGRGKGKAVAAPQPASFAGDEFSRIEDFTATEHKVALEDAPEFQLNSDAHTTSSKAVLPSGFTRHDAANDPLAEFYAQAKKDIDTEWINSSERESEGGSPPPEKGIRKPAFTCDQKGVNVGQCVNQDIVDKLTELMELHQSKLSKDDRWRAFNQIASGLSLRLIRLSPAIRAIKNYPTRIQSFSEAKAIKDVGEKTARKITEIIETGALKRIEYENTDDVRAMAIFKEIYGVGLNTAHNWYAAGCRTLEDIKQRKGGIQVTYVQEIGLKYYDDINQRIPRSEVTEIWNMIRPIALEIDPRLFIQIMGSYRRGKDTCGDIDILITRPIDDGKTHQGVLRRLLKELHLHGILTEDLAVPDFNSLEGTYRGLCRRDEASIRRRIDILVVEYENRGAALMYYTFNRAIRYKAGKMGYSLSQRGLFKNVIRDNNDRRRKLTAGVKIASETEEEIFRILEVPWQEPHERVRH
ncbi:Nucleotidyltransferase [Phellopilus nigrolimitatus]|nr:Nucleotidyltransferase [Phellopilus nigrolimitatus]